MNYRHAFHAGNFADCHKHALLHALLEGLLRKPTPLRVLDTHAGIGRYDLSAEQARRTDEAAAGILRLLEVADGPLAPWLDLVRAAGVAAYPGSPALAAAMLRADDRLSLVELHPEDHAALRAAFRADRRVETHRRDAYEAARALTPFPEKRGLVLYDPPFEAPGEFDRLAGAIAAVHRRARFHVQAAWYPIKGRAPVRGFHAALKAAGIPNILACELHLRAPTDAARLNGSGLLVVNPPWGFEDAARARMDALAARLATGEAGGGWSLERIADE